MGKPSAKLLPRCAPFIPQLWGEPLAQLLVMVEHAIKLEGGVAIQDDGVLLVVEAHAARIEIGGAYGAQSAVDHHYLGMMEAWLIEPDVSPAFHQLVNVVVDAVGC